MRQQDSILILLVLTVTACGDERAPLAPTSTDPPFSGTIFIDPDIITAADPSSFDALSYAGQDARTVFDRRVNSWVTIDAFLFDATFDDGLTTEIQVNPEFGAAAAARVEAEKYAAVIGRMPTVLRRDIDAVWIHQGTQPLGGGNRSVLIHIGQAELYAADGILEEALAHEASHTSLDAAHASASGWAAARDADGRFISTYARDHPVREDVAETFVAWLAVRHRSDRISPSIARTIRQTIPNRIAYLDAQPFEMHPIE